MRETLTKALYSSCPIIYRNRDAADTENRTQMVWGFQCGSGWFELLLNLSQAIEAIAEGRKQQGIPEHELPLVNQVKEKFGELRVYMKISGPGITELINEAQLDSTEICDCCGKPGEPVSVYGYVLTRCQQHIDEPVT